MNQPSTAPGTVTGCGPNTGIVRLARLRRARTSAVAPAGARPTPRYACTLAVPHHREQIAAEAAHVRRDDAEHEVRGERGVDRVAAVGEHRGARRRREIVRRRDDAVRIRPRLLQPHAARDSWSRATLIGRLRRSRRFGRWNSTSPTCSKPSPTRCPIASRSSRATAASPTASSTSARTGSRSYLRDVGVLPGPARRHLRVQPRRVGRGDARLLQGAGRADQRELPLRRRGAALPVRQRRSRRARSSRPSSVRTSRRCSRACRS